MASAGPNCRIILTTQGSYHGTTIATMAASGNAENMHFVRELDPLFVRLPPTPDGDLERSDAFVAELVATIERVGADRIAAFMSEPIPVTWGLRRPHADHWRKVKETLHEYGILYITDEVLSGFGRTGKLFAQNYFDVTGDLITLSKGLSSGYAPISACVASEQVAAAFENYGPRALRHMGTYTAHATGCSVAMRAIDIIEDEGLVENSRVQGERLGRGLERIAAAHGDRVQAPSGLGLFWTITLEADGEREMAREVLAASRERGMILQAWGDVLYLYLPLVVTAEQVDEVLAILADSFDDVLGAGRLAEK